MLITNTFYDQQDRVMDQLEHDKILFYRYLKGLSEHLLEGISHQLTLVFSDSLCLDPFYSAVIYYYCLSLYLLISIIFFLLLIFKLLFLLFVNVCDPFSPGREE
jgi:hypothetical protein